MKESVRLPLAGPTVWADPLLARAAIFHFEPTGSIARRRKSLCGARQPIDFQDG
jgi:hypothetical protein